MRARRRKGDRALRVCRRPSKSTANANVDGAAARDRIDDATAGKFCILGAGSSGLTVAKNFLDRGIAFDCLERESDIGGSWNIANSRSSIYRSTRLISSKRLTEYADFPMPEDFPDHPGQRLICQYLRSYADHFDLRPHIEFNTGVKWLEPASQPSPNGRGQGEGSDGGGWLITVASGDRRPLSRHRHCQRAQLGSALAELSWAI